MSDSTVFCAVAQANSLAGAGKALGISRSLVSKRITELERRLGPRLLNRSTRSLSLTEAGELLYQRYRDIEKRTEQVEREVADLRKSLSGTVRLAAPPAFARISTQLIADLAVASPGIEIRLTLIDDRFEFIASGCDVAVHIGKLKNSNLICRKAGVSTPVICATKKYLAKHGRPTSPEELESHNCLALSVPGEGNHSWHFRRKGGKAQNIQVGGTLSTDDERVLLQACLDGIGLCQLPLVLVKHHMQSGALERVLDDFGHIEDAIYVVLPHRNLTKKVRVIVDHLRVVLADSLSQ
ncbi:MAG: LysR family transcriptional regulator [Gammaproteobacteria bacterium]|nr:LysR family transcriptional regulator [Gammaproteobacteria bacterium]